MAGQYYKVEECEYLAQIAAKFGFTDYNAIWNDPKNAALKAKRKYHNVLYPGDILWIPDKQDKQESRATGQRHVFQTPTAALKLRVVVKDLSDEPVTSAPCQLHLDNAITQLTTDGSGLVEKPELALKSKEGTLQIHSAKLPLGEWDVTLRIGCLDPEDTPTGQQARLNNLGYFAGYTADNDKQLKWAVEEFQCDHMGPGSVDGVCGPKTQAKLVEVHGC